MLQPIYTQVNYLLAPCFGTKLYDPHWAVYMWYDIEMTKWYAVFQVYLDYIRNNIKEDSKLAKMSWKELVAFDADKKKIYVHDKYLKYTLNKVLNKTSYIYTVDIPYNKIESLRLGHSAKWNEYTSKEPVNIIKRDTLVITKNIIDEYVIPASSELLKKKNIERDNTTRGIESIIFLDKDEYSTKEEKLYSLRTNKNISDGKGDLNKLLDYKKSNIPIVFSDKDVYVNMSKFPDPYNIVFVTGFSGAGKSTITRKLSKQYGAIDLSIDDIHVKPWKYANNKGISSMEELISKITNTNSYKNDPKSAQFIKAFLESSSGKELFKLFTGKDVFNVFSPEIVRRTMEIVLEYIQNSGYKKPIILEGTQLCCVSDINKRYIHYPWIIKGTSVLKSVWRRTMRDKFRALKWIPDYNDWRKIQNHVRNLVIPASTDVKYKDE